MHYDKYSSSVDPYYGWYPVMENKNDPWMELGNYIGMTPTDIAEVLAVYGWVAFLIFYNKHFSDLHKFPVDSHF